MSRATSGAARHRKKKRLFKRVKGFHGSAGRNWRLAQEFAVRADCNAYRDRRARKRDFRKLWITRLSAACKMRGIAYSRFIFGLQAADVELNRKVLSEMAIFFPLDFDAIVEIAKQHAPAASAAAA
jgi:large subunit ribosomal protein L20